jgi:hypothetical protein
MRYWDRDDRLASGRARGGDVVIGSLDTHETVKALTAAGFSDSQAEALTAVVKRAVDIDLSNITTKADLADLRRELSIEIADLRRELAQLELRLIKWVIGVGIAATLGVGGMIWTAMQVLLRGFPHP